MKKILLYTFLLISATHVGAILTNVSIIQTISKPMLLICLVVYYISASSTRNSVFLSALFFCWMGDVLLMFSGELFFMLGLVAFLTGHVLYIFSYRQFRNKKGEGEVNAIQQLRLAFPIVLAGTGLVVVLFPYLGEMKIPVMIYALVITLMAIQALMRRGYTSDKSFWLIFSGALFFMISDSALAINKFMHPIPMASLIIMSTYLTAQFLIVEGVIEHNRMSAKISSEKA